MIAIAASSSGREPALSASAREINLPERSMTNAILALPVCPHASTGKNLLLAMCADALALGFGLRMCGENCQQSEDGGQQGEFHLHRCGY
jgi:hypothetical protein